MTVYRRNPLLMTVMGANPGPRTRKGAERALDAAISGAWHRLMSGVQVPIMDIPRIFRDIKLEMAAGVPLEQAVTSVGTRYRVNPGRFRRHVRRNPLGEAIIGGLTGALVNRAFQSNPGPAFVVIDSISGLVVYTKRATGVGSQAIASCVVKAKIYAERTGRPHIVFLDMMGVKVGMKVSVGGVRILGITEEIFPQGYGQGPRAKLNPAIRTSWDGLTTAQRLKILEFAGISEDEAPYLCNKSWERLGKIDPRAQALVMKGWHDSSRTSRRHRDTGTRHRERETVRMNPGGSKRKTTMTIERFAAKVKSKKDPAMWRAFLSKFRGYEKWTHGAKARKVTVEWVDTPGVNGLWITYDGGKQPESTYIMPKGSPRKGAWKHPWNTMPDIKHDPEARIVITKLRGSSKITDYYHK